MKIIGIIIIKERALPSISSSPTPVGFTSSDIFGFSVVKPLTIFLSKPTSNFMFFPMFTATNFSFFVALTSTSGPKFLSKFSRSFFTDLKAIVLFLNLLYSICFRIFSFFNAIIFSPLYSSIFPLASSCNILFVSVNIILFVPAQFALGTSFAIPVF